MATRTTKRRPPTILTCTRVPAQVRRTAVVVHPEPVDLDLTASLVVDAPSSRLRDLAAVIAPARQRHILSYVLVRQDSSYEHTRQVLRELTLTTSHRLLVARNDDVRRRVLQALEWGAQDQLIADAEAIGEAVLVRTCSFERLEVPLTRLPALADLTAMERRQFEIDPDGSFLHWPIGDVHLDLEALRLAADPGLAAQAHLERLRHDERLGRAIAAVRARHGLMQTQMGGLSERQVRRIEQGSRPRLSTLSRLAEAHGQEVNDYLSEVAEAMAAAR